MHPLAQGPINEDDIPNAIARIEARIESLAESIDRCRKLSLTARLLFAAGAVWIVLIVLRIVPFAPFHIAGSIAATLGGIVLLGSNSSTWNQTAAALEQAEAQRTALIERIELRVVEERPRWLH